MQFTYTEDGQDCGVIEAAAADEALDLIRDDFDPDLYRGEAETVWIDIRVYSDDGDLVASETVTVDPREPSCAPGKTHRWSAPINIVGGCRESPGVHGHGGGVTIKEVCEHCGWFRVIDTWATRRDTGQQGLESVSYQEPWPSIEIPEGIEELEL